MLGMVTQNIVQLHAQCAHQGLAGYAKNDDGSYTCVWKGGMLSRGFIGLEGQIVAKTHGGKSMQTRHIDSPLDWQTLVQTLSMTLSSPIDDHNQKGSEDYAYRLLVLPMLSERLKTSCIED